MKKQFNLLKVIILALIAAANLLTFNAYSQISNFHKYKIGFNGSLLYNIHNGTFSTYEGVMDCGYFKDANSFGWSAGNVIDIPLLSIMDLSFRLKYIDAGADFKSQSSSPPRISMPDNSLVPLVSEQSLETVLDYFCLDAMAVFPLYKSLYLGIGPSVGIPNRTSYTQYEEIISPDGITYTDGTTKRKIISGKFGEDGTHERQMRFAINLCAGAEFNLKDNFYLTPELGYSLPFTKVLSNSDWKFQSIYAGLTLKYALERTKVIIQEAPPPKEETKKVEPVVVQKIEKPIPSSILQCQNVNSDGTLDNYSEILVKEEASNQLVPLLPYVFFQTNESEIQARYIDLTQPYADGFDEGKLSGNALFVYHHLLNIVGSRMRKSPLSNIVLTGCIEPLKDNGKDLSKSRAETVKNYLVNRYQISPERISIKTRKLPKLPSNRNDEDGLYENMRVEIEADNPAILAPVSLKDRRAQVNPESVKVSIQTVHPENVLSWELKIDDEKGNNQISQSGQGQVPTEYKWSFPKMQMMKLSNENPPVKIFNVHLTLKAENEQTVNAFSQIPLRKQVFSRQFNGELVSDSIIERFNLIFFDFDKALISKFNSDVIPIVQSRIRTNSKVKISGLTDRIGNEQHNEELSSERAEAIKNIILRRIIPEKINYQGLGENLIYDNELPEGRFYNRTVIIEVTTPYTY